MTQITVQLGASKSMKSESASNKLHLLGNIHSAQMVVFETAGDSKMSSKFGSKSFPASDLSKLLDKHSCTAAYLGELLKNEGDEDEGINCILVYVTGDRSNVMGLITDYYDDEHGEGGRHAKNALSTLQPIESQVPMANINKAFR